MPQTPAAGDAFRNHLLRALSAADLALLRPHLRLVQIDLRQHLEEAHCLIGDVYFLEEGLVSVCATGPADVTVEIGLVGREGMTGLAVLLGSYRTPNQAMVQTEGTAYRIGAEQLRRLLRESGTLHRLLLRYVQVFAIQTAQTAIALARAPLEIRLSRWLLMAQDRLGNNHISVTHEALSLVLGVRRASVTEALISLEGKHRIRAHRGKIVVTDREGLEHMVGSLYGLAEHEYRRLLGANDNATGPASRPSRGEMSFRG